MKVDGTDLDISVKSYLGKIEEGILVLLSVKYSDNIFESTYWYTEELDIITFDDELKSLIGDFEKLTDENKKSVISFLRNNTSEYNIIDQLSEFTS